MNFCPNCFGEAGLKRRLKTLASKGALSCSFHGEAAVEISAIVELFDEAFRNNYDKGSSDGEGIQLCDLVTRLMIPTIDSFRDDFVLALMKFEESRIGPDDIAFYQNHTLYGPSTTATFWHSYLWREFTKSILHDNRFFNVEAERLLREIFRSVEKQKTSDGRSPIYLIQPGGDLSSIKRARISDGELSKKIRNNPSVELGAPPQRLCMSGRLNTSGIPVFYGSFDIKTCISELRPSVGSIVYCGDFVVSDEICVLDTTLFEQPQKSLSVFAQHQAIRQDQWVFLQRFMREISKPITPDKEHIEYIPTQVVAEFLRTCYTIRLGGIQRRIDAIIYSSAQHLGGKNIAIFQSRLPKSATTSQEGSDTFTGSKLRYQSCQCFRVTGAEYAATPDYFYDNSLMN